MRTLIANFRKDESGATLVEYGVALLIAIIVGGTGLITLAETTEANISDGDCIAKARTAAEADACTSSS